jgi:hypothetical protein
VLQTSLNVVPRNRSGPKHTRFVRGEIQHRGRRAARRPSSIEQKVDDVTKRSLDVVWIGRRRFATMWRRAVTGRPAAHTARAIASAGTLTPTWPVPPLTSAANGRRGH